MINSCLQTVSNQDNLEFIIFVDNDDSTVYSFPHKNIKFIKGPRQWSTLRLNFASNFATGDVLMYAADDITFESTHWDLKIEKLIQNNGIPCQLITPSDNTCYSGVLATHGFVTREFREALGYFLPPYFPETYPDTWISEIAKLAKCFFYEPDVKIIHHHYRQGNKLAVIDSLNVAKNQANISRNPSLTYKKLHSERRYDALLLAIRNNINLEIKFKYLFGDLLVKILRLEVDNPKYFRLRCIGNLGVLRIFMRKIIGIN